LNILIITKGRKKNNGEKKENKWINNLSIVQKNPQSLQRPWLPEKIHKEQKKTAKEAGEMLPFDG
jgi:hypothetical protein